MPTNRNQKKAAEVSSYVSALLRDHFGKGPTSVHVTIKEPFITAHLRGFLSPTEQVLLNQKEENRILETRDLLMDELRAKIKLDLWKRAGLDIVDVYADWNLENQTGMIFGIMDGDVAEETMEWPAGISRDKVKAEIDKASTLAEKMPSETAVYWLDDRVLFAVREQILVKIEKELIKNGFVEALKIAKRPLERRCFSTVELEAALGRAINEIFVDWDFEGDTGYAVIMLQPQN